MSRYIEFQGGDKNPHTHFSLGAPVHDGKLPSRFREVKGVRVDGQVVAFTNESTVHRLHRALVDSKQLQRRSIAFNCVTFAALMQDIPLRDADHNPFTNTDLDIDSTLVEDTTSAIVLGVQTSNEIADIVRNRHVVVPAPQTTEMSYLHKLGDEGPLCLSSLQKAMNIYHCNAAHPAIVEQQQNHA